MDTDKYSFAEQNPTPVVYPTQRFSGGTSQDVRASIGKFFILPVVPARLSRIQNLYGVLYVKVFTGSTTECHRYRSACSTCQITNRSDCLGDLIFRVVVVGREAD